MDTSKEWQTTGGPERCWNGYHQEGGCEGDREIDGWKKSRMQWQREK